VAVFFSVTVGGETNFLDAGGRPQFTDSNGQAFDVMRTRNPANGNATVQALVATGGAAVTGTVVVEIQIE
jgi:hypothetical protein